MGAHCVHLGHILLHWVRRCRLSHLTVSSAVNEVPFCSIFKFEEGDRLRDWKSPSDSALLYDDAGQE